MYKLYPRHHTLCRLGEKEELIKEREEWPVRYKENQERVDPEEQRKVFLGGWSC